VALLGFAVRAGREHTALRDREGGRPMFEPARTAALPHDALLFIDTDHGFALAARPEAPRAVARRRGDALDYMAWDAAGRPPAFAYTYDPGAAVAVPSVAPFDFGIDARDAAPGTLPPSQRTIEAESLWPPAVQGLGWVRTAYATGTCASAGRWLEMVPQDAMAGGLQRGCNGPWDPSNPHPCVGDIVVAQASLEVPLPVPWLRGARVSPRFAITGRARVSVVVLGDGEPVGYVNEMGGNSDRLCVEMYPLDIPTKFSRVGLRIDASFLDRSERVALDALLVEGPSAPPPPGGPVKTR